MKKRLSLWMMLFICIFAVNGLAATKTVADLKLGDYVQMGNYLGEDILWRVVSFEKITGYDNNGNPIMDATDTKTAYAEGYLPLLLSDRILCLKPFDANGSDTTGSHGRGYVCNGTVGYYRRQFGSNYWGDSNLRDWLNSSASAGNVVWSCGNPPDNSHVSGGYNDYADEAGFMNAFTEDEKAALVTVTQKSLLDGYEHSGSINSNYHVYSYNISSVVQNYTTAYSEHITDTVFLPDVKQINTVYNNSATLGSNYYIGKPTVACVADSEYTNDGLNTNAFWYSFLRSPYAGSHGYGLNVRCVDSSGDVNDYGNACYGHNGVRPAFFLNPSATILAATGDNSADNPYTLGDSVSVVPVTAVILDNPSATLAVGDTLTLTAAVTPDNATDKSVTWTSSDENVATVVDGVVTAVGKGTATVTATTADGAYTAKCVVTVIQPVTSVTLDKPSATLAVGDTLTLTATVIPDNATDKSVTWTSSDENVATVIDGVVTAVGKGTATVTATTVSGGFTAACNVTVKLPTEIFSATSFKANGHLIITANIPTSDMSKYVHMATYDADGRLTAYYIMPASCSDNTAHFLLPSADGIAEVKVFLWSAVEQITPLGECVELTVS